MIYINTGNLSSLLEQTQRKSAWYYVYSMISVIHSMRDVCVNSPGQAVILMKPHVKEGM